MSHAYWLRPGVRTLSPKLVSVGSSLGEIRTNSMTTARLGDAVALPFLPLPFRRVRASVRRLKTGMSAFHRNANPSTLRNRGALQAGVSRSEYLRPIGTSIPRRGGIGAEPVGENAAASVMWRTHAPGGCCGISAAEDAGAHIVLAEPRSLDEAASGRAPRQGGTGTSSDPRGCGERVGVGSGEDAGTHHDTHYPLR